MGNSGKVSHDGFGWPKMPDRDRISCIRKDMRSALAGLKGVLRGKKWEVLGGISSISTLVYLAAANLKSSVELETARGRTEGRGPVGLHRSKVHKRPLIPRSKSPLSIVRLTA